MHFATLSNIRLAYIRNRLKLIKYFENFDKGISLTLQQFLLQRGRLEYDPNFPSIRRLHMDLIHFIFFIRGFFFAQFVCFINKIDSHISKLFRSLLQQHPLDKPI